MSKISILGSGGWGTALAVMSAGLDHEVSVWSPFEDEIKNLQTTRENPLLKGITIPYDIIFTTDMTVAVDADIIILAVPSFAMKSTTLKLAEIISEKSIVVNVSKGFDEESLRGLSDIIEEILPNNPVVTLSGPSHAEEVARGIPTSVVIASKNNTAAEFVQDTLMHSELRIYTNDDIIGVELGGALKNIIALATGICDGMGLGDNTKAALITRGIAEMSRLGKAMGAKVETFMGLSGIGDLVVTCTSMHSRNRRFGILIGKGLDVESAQKEIGMTVEGYHATKLAYRLANKHDVEMPITNQCYKILYEGFSPQESIKLLMRRPKISENEVKYPIN